MTQQYIDVYSEETKEVFQINDQLLEVLPSDIAAFSDNAVFEETFVRSKAVFAFRSKHSRGKVIITLPVSVSAFSDFDANSKLNQNQGLTVLNQLSNFPYCFIKSSRIRSYISSRAKISSTGFMMFAVDEINTVHDMRVPDVLFVEFHLVFCDHTSQTKDFKFYHNETSPGVDDPALSGTFVKAFAFDGEERFNNSLQMIKSVLASTNTSSSIAYVESQEPLGSVRVLAPNVLNKTEIGEDFYEEELKKIKSLGFYKEVSISSPDGQDSLTAAFFRDSSKTVAQTEEEEEKQFKDAKQTFHIYWTNFHDFSFGGSSAVKSIKISRKNKLAQHFIGTHKYPFVQYMGKYPARVEIGLDFITGDLYKSGQTSVVSAIGQMNNILDYNNDFYPEIGAFNVLKMQSVSSILMGVESIVPNQTFISASSDNQGVETVTVNFVEADMEDFMDVGLKFEGRPSQYFDTLTDTETKAVLAYLNAIKSNANVRKSIEDSPDRELHISAMEAIKNASTGIKQEFFGTAKVSDVKNQALSKSTSPEDVGLPGTATPTSYDAGTLDKEANKDILKVLNYSQSTLAWPNTTLGMSAIYHPEDIDALIDIVNRRQKLIAATQANVGKAYNDETKATSGIQYTLKDEEGKPFVVDASETYSRSGTTDVNIRKAYQLLVSLKAKGDATAKSLLPDTAVDDSYLINRINSYAGINIKDIPFAELADQNVSPFFFLKMLPYFNESQLVSMHNTLAGEVNSAAQTIITKIVEEEDSSALGNSSYFSLFDQSGISVEEMYIVESSDDNQVYNAAGSVVDMASYGVGSGEGYAGMSSKNTTMYDSIIIEKAKQYGVDAGWIKAIIHQESRFNPNARSPVGAEGLMQMMPATAKRWKVTDRRNPTQSIDGGTQYFAWLLKRFKGNTSLALAGYNAGEGNVDKYGGIPPFKETQGYVKKVTNYYNTLYKAGLDSAPSSASYKANDVNVNKGTSSTAKAAGANGLDLSKYQFVAAKDITIVDGDTIRINGQLIRIKHYDTPEIDHSISQKDIGTSEIKVTAWTKGQSYGKTSKDYFTSLISGGIYVEKNMEKDSVYATRKMTSVYLPDSGKNIAEEMIKAGAATVYSQETGGGSALMTSLKKLQDTAKKNSTGLWNSQYADSQNVAASKRAKEALEAALKKATSESAILAAFKANTAAIGGATYTVNGKTYDSKTHKLLSSGTTAAKGSTSQSSASDFKNTFGTTNKDIHVQNAVPSDLTSQWGLRDMNRGFHAGIDSTGHKSHAIIAAADGVVTYDTMNKGGRVIVMNHGNGFYTKYLHLNKYIAANNSKVKTGAVIGEMGNSGTKQVHLHQETWVQPYGNSNKFNVNPWKTTSLKMLTTLKGEDVQKNLAQFIDKTHLQSAHPSQLGVSVLTNPIAAKQVWGGQGKGDSSHNTAAGLVAGLAFAPQTITNDGKIENAYAYKDAAKIQKRDVPPKASVYYEDGAVEVQARNMAYYQKYGANIAFPTMKLYVTIGNEAEDAKMLKEMMPNYYFEIDGIKDAVLVCNNDENPVDFLSFKIANASFIRTDNYAVAGKYLVRDLSKIGTSGEVSFVADRVKLRPGTQLHVRAGYGNNPNYLRTIFNGCVTELGNEDGVCLDVIAEGYGRELLMDAISPHKPTTPGNFFTNNSTPLVIATALGNREGIAHFGNRVNFWSVLGSVVTSLPLVPGDIKGHDYSDPETKRLTTLYADTEFRPGNYRQRLFTNIYAAEIEKRHQEYNSTWWNRIGNLFSLTEQSGYYYIMHGQTPWSVLKEMEYRHPGTLAKPLFFEDRMTMFYGLKEQMYIARDLDSSFMAKIATYEDNSMKAEYIKNRPLRFDTVCNFHIISSELNMIQNHIKINAQYNSCANVIYFEDKEDIVEKYENDDLKEFKMKMDDNLAQWEHRYKTVEMPGIHGKYSAFMYGTTELRRQAETMYGGNIVVIGNPCMKAGDYAYFSDNARRFNGLIKIRECRHYFDESRGYVTEITPGLFVEAASFIYSALFLKLAFTARTALANATLSAQIISNEGIDFQQYLSYFKSLQPFVKKDRGIGVSSVADWFSMAYDETAGMPIAGLALTGLSAYGTLRLARSLTNASFSKLQSKGILNAKDVSSIGAAFRDLKNIQLKSATSGKLLVKSLDFVKAMKGASVLSKLGNAAAAFGTASGAASWWAATRTLKSISALANVVTLSNPVGWMLGIAGHVALSFVFAKVQEAELTRQPLMMFPLLCNGRPYTGGITGYNYNTYLESLKQNFNENWSKVSKAGAVMEATSSNSIVKATGAMLADSNAFGLAENSYNQEQVEKLSKLSYKKLNKE